jgi:hypothetical protein
MHTVLPQTLLDRLVLHHQIGAVATPEFEGHGHRVIGPDETQSLDHMFYTSAVVAVYQLMEVRDHLVSTKHWNISLIYYIVLGRTTCRHTQTMRGSAVPRLREMELDAQVTAGNLHGRPLAARHYH